MCDDTKCVTLLQFSTVTVKVKDQRTMRPAVQVKIYK